MYHTREYTRHRDLQFLSKAARRLTHLLSNSPEPLPRLPRLPLLHRVDKFVPFLTHCLCASPACCFLLGISVSIGVTFPHRLQLYMSTRVAAACYATAHCFVALSFRYRLHLAGPSRASAQAESALGLFPCSASIGNHIS